MHLFVCVVHAQTNSSSFYPPYKQSRLPNGIFILPLSIFPHVHLSISFRLTHFWHFKHFCSICILYNSQWSHKILESVLHLTIWFDSMSHIFPWSHHRNQWMVLSSKNGHCEVFLDHMRDMFIPSHLLLN